MRPIWKFRLLALLIVLFVGGVSIADLAAEFLRPPPLPFSSTTDNAPRPDRVSAAGFAASIAPFRSDLKADHALALAGQLLKSDDVGQSEKKIAAQDTVRDALRIGPHDARMWLVLALLQARSAVDPLAALKMSYLTGPNREELIPTRLASVASGNALNDPDLRDLARGDVRAILTQLPSQRQALTNAYARGPAVAKAFLEESVQAFDPKSVDALRTAK